MSARRRQIAALHRQPRHQQRRLRRIIQSTVLLAQLLRQGLGSAVIRIGDITVSAATIGAFGIGTGTFTVSAIIPGIGITIGAVTATVLGIGTGTFTASAIIPGIGITIGAVTVTVLGIGTGTFTVSTIIPGIGITIGAVTATVLGIGTGTFTVSTIIPGIGITIGAVTVTVLGIGTVTFAVNTAIPGIGITIGAVIPGRLGRGFFLGDARAFGGDAFHQLGKQVGGGLAAFILGLAPPVVAEDGAEAEQHAAGHRRGVFLPPIFQALGLFLFA